jgi:ketosteroid isomerase-like protein
MSQNLDLVRSIYATWERGDFSSAEWADPEIEYLIPDGPSPGAWVGVAGRHEPWRDFLSAWADLRLEAEEYRELDHDRVLVLDHFSGRGKASGLAISEVGAKGANLLEVHDGKVTRLVRYYDREHAFADLGLERDSERS